METLVQQFLPTSILKTAYYILIITTYEKYETKGI